MHGVGGADTAGYNSGEDLKRVRRGEAPVDEYAWGDEAENVLVRGDMAPAMRSACWYQPRVKASGLHPVSCSYG